MAAVVGAELFGYFTAELQIDGRVVIVVPPGAVAQERPSENHGRRWNRFRNKIHLPHSLIHYQAASR